MAMRYSDLEGGAEEIVAEINITPLTDIFLVLLIIFMISSSALMESGLNVKLPTAHSTSVANPDKGKPVFVTVGKEADIRINDQTVDEKSLLAKLKETLSKTENKTVIIRGDEGINLGKAVKIMDAARSAGADKIAIATQNPNG
jgi:biopolymer transport protein ExbD